MAKVLFFGELKEMTGCLECPISAKDTNELRAMLLQKWPALGAKTFSLAVNRKMMQANTELNEADEIAVMPPFSGG